MATRNGEPFLDQQLRSLAAQTYPRIDVHVSDDLSSDGTMRILSQWARRWTKGRFEVAAGPDLGFAENFRSLLADARIEADYVAFCDQDDIWEPTKLERAIAWLGGDAGRPMLFCSRTRIIDAGGADTGHSSLLRRPPSFRNALVQSIAGGNTMVFNRAAHRLLARSSGRATYTFHDWWTYIVVTGAGGNVFYCPEPLVRYRQHPHNSVGANMTLNSRLTRLARLMTGQYARSTELNIQAIDLNRDILTPQALADFDNFRACREGGLARRVKHLRASGVYRQSLAGDLALYTAVITGRL